MDNYFIVELAKVTKLSFDPENSLEIIALLLPYKDYVDKKVAGKNVISFYSPLDKDLFYKFKAEDKKYKIVQPEYAMFYFYLGQAYAFLGNYDEAIKFLKKAHKINPMDVKITNVLLGCMFNDYKHSYPEKRALIDHECKFSLSKSMLSAGLSDFGDFFCEYQLFDAACCCFALSNEYELNEYSVDCFKQIIEGEDIELINSKEGRKRLSSAFGFPIGFNKDVKNFIVELATSELAKKDFDGFSYYLSELAEIDESYKIEFENYEKSNKTNLKPNPNPIETCFNDFNDFELMPQDNVSLNDYLYYELIDYKNLLNAGISKGKAKKTLIDLAVFLYEMGGTPIENVYYLCKALDYKVPKKIMNNIYKSRKNKDKETRQLENDLSFIQKQNKLTKEEAIAEILYYLFEEYQNEEFTLNGIVYIALFLGYHFDVEFIKGIDNSEVSSFYLYDDEENQYLVDFDIEGEKPIFKNVAKENKDGSKKV